MDENFIFVKNVVSSKIKMNFIYFFKELKMDLYSLPKDMLVKLVSDIREETKNEYNELILKLLDINARMRKIVCGKCNIFILFEIEYTVEYYEYKIIKIWHKSDNCINDTSDFKQCQICCKHFCKKHYDQLIEKENPLSNEHKTKCKGYCESLKYG